MGQRAYQCVSTSLSSFTVGGYLVSESVRKLQDPKKCKNMGKYDAMTARNACSTSWLHLGQDTHYSCLAHGCQDITARKLPKIEKFLKMRDTVSFGKSSHM